MSLLHTLQLLNSLHRLPIQPAQRLPSEDEIGSVLQQKELIFRGMGYHSYLSYTSIQRSKFYTYCELKQNYPYSIWHPVSFFKTLPIINC